MSFAETNQIDIAVIKETTFGVLPTTPTMKSIGITSESLSHGVETTDSNTIRSDRKSLDAVVVGANPSGSVSFELSTENLNEDLLEGVFAHSFYGKAQGSVTSTVTADTIEIAGVTDLTKRFTAGEFVQIVGSTLNTGSLEILSLTDTVLTMNDTLATETVDGNVRWVIDPGDLSIASGKINSAALYDFTTLVEVGMCITLVGFTTSTNNKVVTVSAVTATDLTVEETLTDEVAASGYLVPFAFLKDGVTKKSFSIERINNDVGAYTLFRGMTPSQMTLTFTSKAIITGSMEFIGADLVSTDVDTSAFHSTLVAAPTNESLNATSDVASLSIDNTPVVFGTTLISEFNFTLNNNARGQSGIGVLGNAGVGFGFSAITGNLNMFFDGQTYYEKFINNTALSISVRSVGNDGESIAVYIPRLKIQQNPGGQATGVNADVMQNMTWKASVSATNDYQIMFQKSN